MNTRMNRATNLAKAAVIIAAAALIGFTVIHKDDVNVNESTPQIATLQAPANLHTSRIAESR